VSSTTTAKAGGDGHLRQLTPLLVWAVVFCDIGTSVFYVPGLLYRNPHVGDLAPLFVCATFLGFLLLAYKYVEVCWRIPDGGGVVNISNMAFTPVVACLGGLFISVSYFLTSAISSIAGIHYLSSLFPVLEHHVVPLSVASLLLLAIVNTIGIRESAALALILATASFITSCTAVVMIVSNMQPGEWQMVWANLSQVSELNGKTFLVGFSLAWLAFSGLEAISQLSPAMKLPIKASATRGMIYVVVAMFVTSPFLTLFAIALLPSAVKVGEGEKLISALGQAYGGNWLMTAIVLTGSALLMLAANTAIIGCYHVFIALSDRGFLPSTIAMRNRRFGTPQLAILVATLIPILVIYFARGDMDLLGDLYAFGLLGAFGLSSAGLDVIRWREGQRGMRVWIGIGTTVMVVTAWAVNLYMKPNATLIGTLLVAVGALIAVGTRRKWFSDLLYQMPMVAKIAPRRILENEAQLEDDSALEILSLNQAESIAQLYPSKTMIAIRSHNPGLLSEAISREKGLGGRTVYALYVEEYTGLFVGSANRKPAQEGIEALKLSVRSGEAEGMMVIPVYTVSWNAVEGIKRAAESLDVSAIMIGATQRTTIYHLLRGHVLAGLTKRLPPGIRLLIYG